MTILKQLALILTAYAVASLFTGYVVTFNLLFADSGMAGDARNGFPTFGLFVSFMVAYFAAAPAALTAAVGELTSFRHWWYYSIAGSLIGLTLGYMFRPPEFFPWLGIGLGAAAGGIFWFIAGRRAGQNERSHRLILSGLLAAGTIFLMVISWAAFIGFRF